MRAAGSHVARTPAPHQQAAAPAPAARVVTRSGPLPTSPGLLVARPQAEPVGRLAPLRDARPLPPGDFPDPGALFAEEGEAFRWLFRVSQNSYLYTACATDPAIPHVLPPGWSVAQTVDVSAGADPATGAPVRLPLVWVLASADGGQLALVVRATQSSWDWRTNFSVNQARCWSARRLAPLAGCQPCWLRPVSQGEGLALRCTEADQPCRRPSAPPCAPAAACSPFDPVQSRGDPELEPLLGPGGLHSGFTAVFKEVRDCGGPRVWVGLHACSESWAARTHAGRRRQRSRPPPLPPRARLALAGVAGARAHPG